MASDDAVNRVLDACDIVEVIGEVINLRPRGSNWVGLCPFHTEKTPSFTVSPSKGIYSCFGCGKKGNVFTFMKDYYGMEFGEALRELAKKYNVRLNDYKGSTRSKQELSRREIALECMNEAEGIFSNLLTTTAGKPAKNYLTQRGIRNDTIKDYGLGYSSSSWDMLYNKLIKKGYKDANLLDAGLVINRESGGYYDRFRDRLMFAIHDPLGKIVGFGARQMSDEPNQPKYINSPQTIIYDKSKILYGLFQAKNEIRKHGFAILTEGYLDVLTLHQSGFKTAVASSGTALTKQQLKELKKYCSKMYIVYDADEAGVNAALKAIDLALAMNFDLRIVSLPKGEDPDSLINKRGADVFNEYLNDAVLFVDFKIQILRQADKLTTPAEIANAIRDCLHSTARIPDKLQQDEYISRLASLLKLSSRQLERVYAEKTNIDNITAKEFIRESEEERAGIAASSNHDSTQEKPGTQTNGNFLPDYSALISEEELIFKYILTQQKAALFIMESIAIVPDKMYSKEGKRLLTLFIDIYGRGVDIAKQALNSDEVHDADKDFIIGLIIKEEQISPEWRNYAKSISDFDYITPIKDALIKIEIRKLDDNINKLQSQLSETDEEQSDRILEQYKSASKKRNELIKLIANEN